jgi:7-carboxy-7-deazaguanine synthase
MPKGEASTERDDIATKAKEFKIYNDLPLVSTGCDSYSSWDVRFKHLSPVLESDAIAKAMVNIIPNRSWDGVHLVITGGEPLLGWQRAYPDLLGHELLYGLDDITFETNGTQPLSSNFVDYLRHWCNGEPDRITFSVSPKLSVSGEKHEDAIKPEIVMSYQQVGFVYLKFVVASESDVDEALEAVKEYKAAGFDGPVYLMPVGGVESVYMLNNKRVAELAIKHGLRYSDRLQVLLFKNAWAT